MVLKDELLNIFQDIISRVFTLIDEEKYEELEKYETDDLLRRQIEGLELIKERHQKLHIDKVSCFPIKDAEDLHYGNARVIKTKVRISFERYITDEQNNVVAGTKEYIIDVWYNISFVENPSSQKIRCQYCGAPVLLSQYKCEYCGTLTKNKTTNWLIIDLEEDHIDDPLHRMRERQKKYDAAQWKEIFGNGKKFSAF